MGYFNMLLKSVIEGIPFTSRDNNLGGFTCLYNTPEFRIY
jgi:hypothetical protein